MSDPRHFFRFRVWRLIEAEGSGLGVVAAVALAGFVAWFLFAG